MNKLLAPLLVIALLGLVWFLVQEDAPTESPVVEHPALQEKVEEAPLEPASLEVEKSPEGIDRVDLDTEQILESEAADIAAQPKLSSATARVLHKNGSPVEGVPLVILRHEPWGVVVIGREITNAEGYATMLDTPYYGPGSDKPTDMTIGFPFPAKGATEAQTFSNEAWPSEPLLFALPETGTMRVHLVDMDGEPWLHPTNCCSK